MERWRDPHWTKTMTIRLDFRHIIPDFVGENKGITRREINELTPRALEIADNMKERRETGELGFYQLPSHLEAASSVSQMASSLRRRCDDFVVLGIGGSALGGIALFHSFCHPLHNILPKSHRGGTPRAFS